MDTSPILRVYCSGPLFSPEERASMAAIAACLEARGHATFLPQRDGLEGLALRLARAPFAKNATLGLADRLLRRAIFSLDAFELLERCDAVVCNLNGRVPDEGTVVEASLAFACGRPILAYKHDARSVFDGRDNPMLTGLFDNESCIRDIGEIAPALERAVVRARLVSPLAPLPPAMAETVRFGEKVWRFLEAVPSLRVEEKIAPGLLEKLAKLGTSAIDGF